jgi:hypothetical protein
MSAMGHVWTSASDLAMSALPNNTEGRALSLAKIEIDWLLTQTRGRLKEQADTALVPAGLSA